MASKDAMPSELVMLNDVPNNEKLLIEYVSDGYPEHKKPPSILSEYNKIKNIDDPVAKHTIKHSTKFSRSVDVNEFELYVRNSIFNRKLENQYKVIKFSI